MKRTIRRWPVVLTVVFLAVATAAVAAEMPEVIKMDASSYEEHTKPFVEFKHASHVDAFPEKYPRFFEDGCGTCHHDDQGRPLSGLEAGDDVDRCIDCHSESGEVPREITRQMREQDLSRAEEKARELEYHAEAMHALCRGCHRDVRKHDRTTAAPTTCMQCHTADD